MVSVDQVRDYVASICNPGFGDQTRFCAECGWIVESAEQRGCTPRTIMFWCVNERCDRYKDQRLGGETLDRPEDARVFIGEFSHDTHRP